MANTNFLQFDPQQTNMLSDANYSNDAERQSGFVTGISRSILFNKTLFQSSAMATALANVIVKRGQDAIDNNLSSLEDSIDLAFPESRGLPIGAIFPTTAPILTAPDGFLLPNGDSFDPVEYPDLATVYRVGTDTYEYGQEYKNGVWWPKTPDLRGYFLRVHNPQAGGFQAGITNPDAGRTLCTSQGDAIRNITGKAGYGIYGWGISGAFAPVDGSSLYERGSGAADYVAEFDASRVVPTADENRPCNYALTYLIVAKNLVNLGSTGSGESTYKGIYDATKQYYTGDIVKESLIANHFYISMQDSLGGSLNNTTYWKEITDRDIVKYTEVSNNVEYPIGCTDSGISGNNYSGTMNFTTTSSPTINASTGALTAPVLKTTTQTQGDNSTNVATTEYVDTAVAGAGSQPTYNSSTNTLEF